MRTTSRHWRTRRLFGLCISLVLAFTVLSGGCGGFFSSLRNDVDFDVFNEELFFNRASNGHVSAKLFHISKECAPIVSFGGVGKMLGELVDAQAMKLDKTSVNVILPLYGFLKTAEVVARTSYNLGHQRVDAIIHLRQVHNVSFFLVSPPSHLPHLWASTRVQDAYNLPKGVRADSRDLFFSFVAAEIIKANARRYPVHDLLVHSHGATNAPVNYFLRHSLPAERKSKIRLVYTVHDYNSEPFITFRPSEVSHYTFHMPGRSQKSIYSLDPAQHERVPFACHPSSIQNVGVHSPYFTDRRKLLHSTYFVSCADAVSTVSKGMMWDLMRAKGDFASLILHFQFG